MRLYAQRKAEADRSPHRDCSGSRVSYPFLLSVVSVVDGDEAASLPAEATLSADDSEPAANVSDSRSGEEPEEEPEEPEETRGGKK